MDAVFKLARVVARVPLQMLLLGALLTQAIVVQAHVHPARAVSAFPAAGTSGGVPVQHLQIGATEDCPLCWEAAMAGHYPLPPSAAVPSAPPAVFRLVAPVIVAFGLAQPPHGWLSRAPPR